MAGHDHHIVGKVNIDINFNDTDYDHAILGDLKEAILDKVQSSLESIPLSGTEIILIDHIDIDLTIEEYPEFPEALEHALKESISRKLKESLSDKGAADKTVSIKNHQQKTWDQLIHYLKYGFFPWNWTGDKDPDFDGINDYLSRTGKSGVNELRDQFASGKALDRFCFELPISVLDAIAHGPHIFSTSLFAKVKSGFEKLVGQLVPSGDVLSISKSQIFRMALLIALRDYWMQGRLFNQSSFLRSFIKAVYDHRHVNELSENIWQGVEKSVRVRLEGITVLLSRGRSFSPDTGEPDWAIVSVAAGLHRSGEILLQSAAEHPKEYSELTSQIRGPKGRLRIDEKNSGTQFKEKDSSGGSDSEQRLFVNNAGLVLLHPFLLPLFQEIKLCDHQKFHGFSEQYQAIYVLQHLSGLDTGSRLGLALNKVLSGLEVDAVMHTGFRWNEEIGNECDRLLATVIKHWSALKKTSISGLQTSFLQREGILEISGQQRRLIVERKPYDILLDKLPWPVSVVKLPWMKTQLWVDW
jgi:hypothetical protein